LHKLTPIRNVQILASDENQSEKLSARSLSTTNQGINTIFVNNNTKISMPIGTRAKQTIIRLLQRACAKNTSSHIQKTYQYVLVRAVFFLLHALYPPLARAQKQLFVKAVRFRTMQQPKNLRLLTPPVAICEGGLITAVCAA